MQFDVILCNMISSEFIALLPEMRRLLAEEGRILLSGALVNERAMVLAAIFDAGLRVTGESPLGEWMGYEVVHG